MVTIHYQKRKNTELFKQFEAPTSLFLSTPQNYIPIYTRFFTLNQTNFNNINLNHLWHISNTTPDRIDDTSNLFMCALKSEDGLKHPVTETREVFFKLAPLLDPYKYLVGKYDVTNPNLFSLPKLQSTTDDCCAKVLDVNNSAYVDGMFLFLSSQLKHNCRFTHGLSYYCSFLAIKNDFTIDVFDDIDYLTNSAFFNKHKNVLFKVDKYDHLFQQEHSKLAPITIGKDISLKSCVSVDNAMFDNVFEEEPTVNDLKDASFDLIDMTTTQSPVEHHVTLKSNSTCSSRSSHTDTEDSGEDTDFVDEDDGDETDFVDEDEGYDTDFVDEDEGNDDGDEGEENEDEDSECYEEERINVTIPKFPVQVIGMEYCEHTFDDLIVNNDLTEQEWLSALMQIIMTLITYQKAFQFTHNDLHTNNVMYNATTHKYVYYCYNNIYYKVPTFGRIFKIIDFGRSIYKFNGKTFCSDSFHPDGDAATQYNTEPYFNEKKPRLEPNYSFDLCRLACSIFDYVIDDFEEMKDLSKIKDPVKRLIFEWCLDDKGINMLYKTNGVDRYPEFKLYKMIARCVHHHTPQAQLERELFAQFKFNPIRPLGKSIGVDAVMNVFTNIDAISSYA